jgi:PPOX class probable F420-dependent enzyme
VSPEEARRRFASSRVARLATSDRLGTPHLVPIVFALDGETLYNAVDHKPKRTPALKRLANIGVNPAVSVLADHYDDDDWSSLWWARADGQAVILSPGSSEESLAIDLLQVRYPAYQGRRPPGPVLAVQVERWSGWAG